MRFSNLAKFEIHKRFGIVSYLWWKFIPGTTIKVKWPSGDVVIDESMPQWDWTVGPSKYIIESADPNDHYRPALEKLVGKQGRDWQWKMDDNDIDNILIKFRKGKDRYASYFALKWSL